MTRIIFAAFVLGFFCSCSSRNSAFRERGDVSVNDLIPDTTEADSTEQAEQDGSGNCNLPFKTIGGASEASAVYVGCFTEGLAPAAEPVIEGEYVTSYRWGYVDEDTTWVIPPRFDGAGSFRNGSAVVYFSDELVVVDVRGELLNPYFEEGGRMGRAPSSLPLPAKPGMLRDYVEQVLGFEDEPRQVYVDPRPGEPIRFFKVARLPNGGSWTADHGWEGLKEMLRLPGQSTEFGVELVRKLSEGKDFEETSSPDEPGAIRIGKPEEDTEMYIVRKGDGNLEIVYQIMS